MAAVGARTAKSCVWNLLLLIGIAFSAFRAGAALSCGLPGAVPEENRQNVLIEGQNIPFGVQPLGWTSARIMSHIGSFLIGEVLGINTTILPEVSSSMAGWYSVSGCETPGDTADRGCGRTFSEAHAVFEAWSSSVSPSAVDQLTAEMDDKVAQGVGDLGYEGHEGLFIPSGPLDAAFGTEGLALEYYKSFNSSWHNPKQFFHSISDIDTTDLLPCSETRFADSILMDLYVQFTGDNDGVEIIDGSRFAKCMGGLNGNWWLSPACRDDPETCIPVIDGGDGWFVDAFMNRAAKYNIPLALSVGSWGKYVAEPQTHDMMFYWWYPDTSFADLRPTPVLFPQFDASGWEAGDKSTDSKKVVTMKYVHYTVPTAASRAYELIQAMQFSMSAIEPMMQEAKMSGAGSEAGIACRWLLDNVDIWQGWVPFETKCPAGWGLTDRQGDYVENRSDAISCDWCSPGRYSVEMTDESGKTHVCTPCALGMHQSTPGQMECLNCAAGTFAGEEGLSLCEACNSGTANHEEGRSACDNCLPGSFQSSRGSTTCSPCAGGTFINEEASTACDNCPLGMFSESNATECQNCSAGYAASVEGSSSCVACSAGYIAAEDGAMECTACPIGEYADDRGLSACEVCGGGAPLWTTMRQLTVQGQAQWVSTDAAESADACGCDVGARFEVDGSCVECDIEGIECPGKGEVVVLRGYYSVESPLSVFACKSGMSCQGGPPGDVCAAGRIGLSCAKCQEGMTPDGSGGCVECTGGDKAPFAIAVIVVIGIFVMLYAALERSGGSEPGHAMMLLGISGGLLVGLMQQLSVVGLLDVEYVEPLHTFLGIVKIFTFDIEEIVRLNCIGSIAAVAHFTTKVCMIIAGAVIVLLVHIMFVLIKHRGRFREQTPTLVAVFGTIVMIFYISVTVTILQPLQCTSNPNGLWTVQAYEEIICWKPDMDSDHAVMLVIGVLALSIPISLFVKVISLVRKLPNALRHSNINFIRSYGFLFFRFRPQAHWYILVVMTRSLLIGVVPVIPQDVAQIYSLQIILLITFAMCIHYKPWRVNSLNWMDAIFGAVMILFMNITAFCVTDASIEVLGWVCVAMVGLSIGLMPLFLLFAVWKKIGKGAKPYQFFLCHCKADAGAFARWLKLELVASPQVKREVFLDSDNLETLDLLLTYVAADVETLVVIASSTIFYRPWCIGEMTTAHVNMVKSAILALPDYTRLEEETISNYAAAVPDIEMLCVDYGMRADTIKDAIRIFSKKESIKMPTRMNESAMTQLGRILIAGDRTGEIKARGVVHNDKLQVAIVCDDNAEAIAIANVLLKLLMPHTVHDLSLIPEVLEPHSEEAIPKTVTKVIFLCTHSCFSNPRYLDRVLEVGDRGLRTFPVIGDDEFRVPKPESFNVLRADTLRPAPGGGERAAVEVGVVVAEVFKDIAVTLKAKHERITALEASGFRVAKRLLNGSKQLKKGVTTKMAGARRMFNLDSQEEETEEWQGDDWEEDDDAFAVDEEESLPVPTVTIYRDPSKGRRKNGSVTSFASHVNRNSQKGDINGKSAAQERYSSESRAPSPGEGRAPSPGREPE